MVLAALLRAELFRRSVSVPKDIGSQVRPRSNSGRNAAGRHQNIVPTGKSNARGRLMVSFIFFANPATDSLLVIQPKMLGSSGNTSPKLRIIFKALRNHIHHGATFTDEVPP